MSSSSYYKNNAIYDYIRNNGINNFYFVTENMWQLIYADLNCNPIILVLASEVKKEKYTENMNNEEKKAFGILCQINDKFRLPILFLKYISNSDRIEDFIISKDGISFSKVSPRELLKIFSDNGLPINEEPISKRINDKPSSTYHSWQRNNLGKNIVAVDIDLLKLNSSDEIEIIFELKRSHIDIEKWNPYAVDKNNFILQSKIAQTMGIKFCIIYNKRQKYPVFIDIISKIKIYNVEYINNELKFESEIKNIQDYIY